MKKYRVCLLDFNRRGTNNKIIFTKYANGIKEARAIYPEIKTRYYYNIKCFSGWKDNKNLIITEI